MPNLSNIRHPGNASNLVFHNTVWDASFSNYSWLTWDNIPAWAKRITLHLSDISTTDSGPLIVKVGNAASSYLTSGYTSYTAWAGNVNQVTSRNETAGYNIDGTSTAGAGWYRFGHVTITNITGSKWVFSHSIGFYSGAAYYMSSGGGGVTISNLDRVGLFPTGSPNQIDWGVARISYEG